MDTRFGLAINRRSQQAAGLVCLWNGAAGQRELIGGDDLTRNSSTNYTPGMLGPAWAFSGSANERLYTGASGQHNQSTAISVFAWIRYTGSGAYAGIVMKDAYPTNRVWDLIVFADNKLYSAVFSSNAVATDLGGVGPTLTDKVWHHVGFTYQYVGAGTSIHRNYVDGMQIAESTSAAGPLQNVSSSVVIGNDGRGTPAEPFYGQIAEARIYNRRVSAAEVYRMWNPATRHDLYRRPHSSTGAPIAAGQPTAARRGWSIATPRIVAGRF